MDRENTSNGSTDEMKIRERIESYLLNSLSDDRGYFKSKEIANDINARTKEVAAVITDLNTQSKKLKVEKWAYTTSTTWLVEKTK